MNCTDCAPLLHAYVDGELDLVRHLEVEGHLKACPACRARAEAIVALRSRVRDAVPRFTASAELRTSIRASLQAWVPPVERAKVARFPGQRWNLALVAASLAVALFLGNAWGEHRAQSRLVVNEAFAEHVRSLQANHLEDVVSTDRHTVKPWFEGKVDFAPPVIDLADVGFPLAGGRLDQIDGHNAAALVFRRKLHVINLFVWAAGDSIRLPDTASEKGYNAQAWTHGGLHFLAVSEIPASDLDSFAREYRRRSE
jgi:anti-sigma factor RsiW